VSYTGAEDVLQHQLDRQRASMLEAVREYEQRLMEQVERNAELEGELAAAAAGAAAREWELRAEIERLRIEAERLGADLGRLKAENVALTSTIHEITDSRSWRMTRPLRALGRGTRQLGGSDTGDA
jgi:hypothetical protein